jgi:YVTN family beta-propeller protein
MRHTLIANLVWMLAAWLMFSTPAAAEVPYVNWENHPVHPLDINPSGTMLAVAHTADNRVQLFDISEGTPGRVGHVLVGVDPVSVRFRTDNELWVVNHISDSVSIVDVPSRRVRRTLQTLDEPYDVVFAGTPERAFVSCSQANTVQVFNPADIGADPLSIAIDAEDPRALAVSPDGSTVYAAIFESGNGSTILPGATAGGHFPPNVTRQPETPYGGQNPPPNSGDGFSPPIADGLPLPPKVAHIIRKDDSGRWMDGNDRDWTEWVSGENAADSGRVAGWDLADHDIAVIDADSLEVSYVSRLMNIGMALSVNPASGMVTLVGTDVENQV